jgi:hypothetical protein
MRFATHTLLAAAIGIAPIVGLSLVGGCEVYHHHDGTVAVVPGADVAVYQPGYYYDNEYYDGAGHYHGRAYYYYDGHHWENRDAVPSGYTASERHAVHREHEVHEQHAADAHDDHDVR